jgi:hypothetical protein
MTIELGYDGNDFVTNSISCRVKNETHSFYFRVCGFYNYNKELRARLILYKTLKELSKSNGHRFIFDDYKRCVLYINGSFCPNLYK